MRRLLLFVFGVLAPVFARADVAVLDVGIPAGANAASLTYSFTVNSGATVMVVGVTTRRNNASVDNTVTYGGVSMTFGGVLQNGTQDHLEWWYKVSPTVGTANVVITPGASAQIVSNAITFSGSSTSVPIRQSTTFSSSGGSQPSTTLLSVLSTNIVLDIASALESATGFTAGSSQTQRWSASQGSAGSTRIWNAASTKATSGNCAALQPWDLPGCNINMSETVLTQPAFSLMFSIEVSVDEPPPAPSRVDQYGGVSDVTCTGQRTPTTYTITNVARTAGLATFTVSATADPAMWTYMPVLVTGVSADSGSFNTDSEAVDLIASVPSGTTFTLQQVGSDVSSTPASGTVTFAHWDTCQIARPDGSLDWYARTPLGHPMKLLYTQQTEDTDASADVNGIRKATTISAKYNLGPDGTGNANWNYMIAMMRNLRRWGFTTGGEYMPLRSRPTADDYHVGDGHPPAAVRMPYIFIVAGMLREAMKGSAGNGRTKFIGGTFKLRYMGQSIAACSQIEAGDPFDPRFPLSVAWQLQRPSHKDDQHQAKYNDYFVGIMSDETDFTGFSRAGYNFNTYRNGSAESPAGSSAGPHWGFLNLVVSPTQVLQTDTGFFDSTTLGASRHSTCGDSIGATPGDYIYDPDNGLDDTTFWGKAELANFLQGTMDSTSGVSASRSAGIVTYTKSGHEFIANETITVRSCSDSTFNTPSGVGNVIASVTSSTFIAAHAGAGTSATGCVVTAGPGYSAIADLNTAWGSTYTTFGSSATTVTGESVGTGNGSTTLFSKTLAHANVDPQSVIIEVSGTATCADDAVNLLDRTNFANAGAFRVGCDRGSSSSNLTSVSLSRTSNVVTATKTAHGLTVGSGINAIESCSPSSGWTSSTRRFVATVPDADHFTYAHTGSDGSTSGCTFRLSPSSISYDTGLIGLKFTTAPANTAPITANYSYGGWGTGTGLLDEDGRNAWIPTNGYNITSADADLVRDLNAYLLRFSKEYHSILREQGDLYMPGRLQIGIINMSNYCAPAPAQVFQGMSPYLDFYGMSNIVCGEDTPDWQDRINFVGDYGGNKPYVVWYTNTADSDSPYTSGTNSETTPQCCANQGARGDRYLENMQEQLDAANTNVSPNVHMFLGLGHWNYSDQRNETQNWGLVSNRDVPYNGLSRTIRTDAYGYTEGCGADGNPTLQTSVSLSRTSNVVTATKTSHGFTTSMYVNTITGCSDSSFNLTTPAAIATAPSSSTFTYAQTGSNGSATGCSVRAVMSACELGPFGDFLTDVITANSLWLNNLTRIRVQGKR